MGICEKFTVVLQTLQIRQGKALELGPMDVEGFHLAFAFSNVSK
jgi:hypothetical protein